MNSGMIKPKTFGHLHLVYQFTIPLRLLQNTFVIQKVESVHFYLMSLTKNLPQVLIITTSGRRKLTIFPKQRFFYYSSAERKGDFKLARVLVTSFDKCYHFCNHCIFGFCFVVP